jgi:hypothetical protein
MHMSKFQLCILFAMLGIVKNDYEKHHLIHNYMYDKKSFLHPFILFERRNDYESIKIMLDRLNT